ncbi:hypothetical protein ES332_D13G130400v1 [Gossypium tomentosum]|uniref:Uncharacterized protein n=1 Tax=Gossypium tomentosum TaxID=34277 RepID=A0A5D2HXP5_GOSTO|nr:hypothetical protein ES332_D13G130400v1 [Gossypium tomentosum]
MIIFSDPFNFPTSDFFRLFRPLFQPSAAPLQSIPSATTTISLPPPSYIVLPIKRSSKVIFNHIHRWWIPCIIILHNIGCYCCFNIASWWKQGQIHFAFHPDNKSYFYAAILPRK